MNKRFLAVVICVGASLFSCAWLSKFFHPPFQGALYDTLQISGNKILDTCGTEIFLRGPEQSSGWQMANDAGPPLSGDPLNLPWFIRQTGANATRAFFSVCPTDYAASCQDNAWVERYLQNTTDAGLITSIMTFWDTYPFLGGSQPLCAFDGGVGTDRICLCTDGQTHPCQQLDSQDSPICCPQPPATCDVSFGGGPGLCRHTYTAWFRKPEVKTMLDRYKKWLLIDTANERGDVDRLTWRNSVVHDVAVFRDAGYTEPLVAISRVAGRDLPAILQYGGAIEAADPLHKTILGWQAYWGGNECKPDAGVCVPRDEYNQTRCAFDSLPTDGWYQQPGTDQDGPYGGQQDLSSPTSIINGIRVAKAKSADAGFPFYVGFNYEELGTVTDYRHMYAEALDAGVSWLYWMFYLPPEWIRSHDAIVDDWNVDVFSWELGCRYYENGLYWVCDRQPPVVQVWHDPPPVGDYCAPSFSIGSTYLTYVDAGTNRACGQ